jgi:hypothetical protein
MSNVRNYSDKEILEKVKSLTSFKSIPAGHWIVGVRSNEDAEDVFDDKFYLFKGEKFIKVTSGTTNPGVPILKGGFLKYNKVGAAVLKANEWYYDVWKYGMHMGKMPALRQVGTFTVYRDGDRDGKAEELGAPIRGAGYGINFHANNWNLNSKVIQTKIGNWSAGCQVSNNLTDYKLFMELLPKDQKVSYCLLQEWNDK